MARMSRRRTVHTSQSPAQRTCIMTVRRSPWMNQELDDLRDLARTFAEKEIKPNIETSIKN
jgi:hypothetical protein